MYEYALDTETTGLNVDDGNRIFEVGIVEMYNCVRTGRRQRWLLDPLCSLESGAEEMTGFTYADVRGKPTFADKVDEIIGFIGNGQLVIHNAGFDLKFLNNELWLVGRNPLNNPVVDTLKLAQDQLGKMRGTSLDALCDKFGVDRSSRDVHGALIDAELLADVYLELRGRNYTMGLDDGASREDSAVQEAASESASALPKEPWPDRGIGRASEDERSAHRTFVEENVTQPLWQFDGGA